MAMRHRLPKLDVLEYALEGAYTIRGTQSGNMTEEYEEQLDKDIAELKRRIKLVQIAEKRKEK